MAPNFFYTKQKGAATSLDTLYRWNDAARA